MEKDYMTMKGYLKQIQKFFRFYTKLLMYKIGGKFSDKCFVKYQYELFTGRKLNLKKPLTYTQKLQWLKLYDRRPEYTRMVDKILMKDFVTQKIGPGHVVPLYAVWEHVEDIDLNELPDQFVIKTNHDSMHKVIICMDKKTFNLDEARTILANSLQSNFYKEYCEWPYKNVRPMIFAEKLLSDGNSDGLVDYKFFCFNGVAKFMYISNDSGEEVFTDFFDMEFNHMPLMFRDGNAAVPPRKPDSFEQMRSMAETLSEGIPHLRVDFYVVDGNIYVGELTFFHNAGLVLPKPEEWDVIIGNMISLPK